MQDAVPVMRSPETCSLSGEMDLGGLRIASPALVGDFKREYRHDMADGLPPPSRESEAQYDMFQLVSTSGTLLKAYTMTAPAKRELSFLGKLKVPK